jgi:CBS domain-containing protein
MALAHNAFEDAIETLGSLVGAPAVAITAAMPLAEVRRLLVRHRVPALAVVDDRNRLRGLVTRTDVLRALDERGATAGDAMSGFVFTLPALSKIERAAALMAYEGVGQIVVLDAAGEVVGMVSALDVARHYAAATGYLLE